LKSLLLSASVAAILSGMVLSAQEKSAKPLTVPVSFQAPRAYSSDDIKVMGTLTSGQTSAPVEYSHPGPYRAFVFEGHGHDLVDITVTGANGKAFVALADATLTPIASGIGRVSTTLPYHGPDLEAFYVLLKPTSRGAARFTVHLKETPGSGQPADATR
jgi:hypothetical protein